MGHVWTSSFLLFQFTAVTDSHLPSPQTPDHQFIGSVAKVSVPNSLSWLRQIPAFLSSMHTVFVRAVLRARVAVLPVVAHAVAAVDCGRAVPRAVARPFALVAHTCAAP
jgi:hypothetical protein